MTEIVLAVCINVKTLRVLMIREQGKKEMRFPGGHMEMHENHAETMPRELSEELGREFGLKMSDAKPFMDFVCSTKNHAQALFRVYLMEFDEVGTVVYEKGISQASLVSIHKDIPLLEAGEIIMSKLRSLYKKQYTLAA